MQQIHKNFEVHDHFHFEMKLDYWLNDANKHNYRVDLFLFLPNALGLNQHSYPRDAFYDDIKNHVRLKTPELSLNQAASQEEGQPGRLLVDSVAALKIRPTTEHDRLVEYHTKMYTSITVKALYNRRSVCLDDLKQGHTASTLATIREIDSTLNLIRKIAAEISQIKPEHDRLPTILKSADEYLTSEATQSLLKLLGSLTEGAEHYQSLHPSLLAAVGRQSQHAEDEGYQSLEVHSATQDETVLFRRSIFKKFFRSPLFLSQSHQADGRWASHLAMGFAAGLSMVFATLIAFLAQQKFGNFTLPLFVALVVGYVFKDRIKELTKFYLDKRLSKHLADSKTHFFDQDGHKMGLCHETVRFVKADKVPGQILALRNKDHLTEIANFWQAEKIIHYQKSVSLFGKPLRRANPDYETAAVNDIIRYNVRRLLWNMDEPEKELLAMHDNGSVGKVAGARVYKINLLLRLSAGSEEQLIRFRLILDRDGIRRMEKI